MPAFLKAVSYYLPEKILNNDQLNTEFPEWSAEKISQKTGIYERRISEENEYSSDLGFKAATKLFEEHTINPGSIDFILFCTQSPDYFLPTTACILQQRLDIPTSAGALDYNLGCSGYVYGLALAKGLITAGIAKNVLLITAETYSKFINNKDKSNRTIFGDAASASLIVDYNEGAEIYNFSLGSDGAGAENLIVKNGGMRYRNVVGKDIFGENGYERNDDNLYMKGSEIFIFTSKAVPLLVYDTLSKNQMNLDNIDLFVFHQANEFMLEHIRKKMQIPTDKFYISLRNCGNTVSSTIPIALHQAIKEKRINKNSTILLAGFGVGYSWGGVILKY
ncbi:MAG: ketoacyl-ACP synthase [Mucilaginibacter sp.]|nr:ketoacyl-ACP synthase [Mucilaginibacter sp.]